MEQPAYEWRSAAPRGRVLHKAVAGEARTICGVPVASLPSRAPVDPARRGWPIGACRRCRAAYGPYGSWGTHVYIEREARALAARARLGEGDC